MDAGEELEWTMDEYRDLFAEVKHNQKDKEDLHYWRMGRPFYNLVDWEFSVSEMSKPKWVNRISLLG